jgi:hypothetical protein
LFACLSITIQAQHFGISAEGSFQAFTSQIKDASDIRVDPASTYQFITYNESPYANMMSNGGGVLFERFSPNEHWSLATGLQYRAITSEIDAAEAQYFFYRYAQEGLDTHYLRITSIKQNVSCIGIPLQVRFFPLVAEGFGSTQR